MADSTSTIPQVSSGAANKEATINSVNDAASPSMLCGRNFLTSTGLTWGFLGGRFNSTAIPNGTVALTASTINYVVAARATGVVSNSTVITNWNDATNYVRLYLIVTGASTVTSYQDHRQAIGFDPAAMQLRSKTGSPTTGDIPAGFAAVWKNTTDSTVRLWVNDSGTLKSVTLT